MNKPTVVFFPTHSGLLTKGLSWVFVGYLRVLTHSQRPAQAGAHEPAVAAERWYFTKSEASPKLVQELENKDCTSHFTTSNIMYLRYLEMVQAPKDHIK